MIIYLLRGEQNFIVMIFISDLCCMFSSFHSVVLGDNEKLVFYTLFQLYRFICIYYDASDDNIVSLYL